MRKINYISSSIGIVLFLGACEQKSEASKQDLIEKGTEILENGTVYEFSLDLSFESDSDILSTVKCLNQSSESATRANAEATNKYLQETVFSNPQKFSKREVLITTIENWSCVAHGAAIRD